MNEEIKIGGKVYLFPPVKGIKKEEGFTFAFNALLELMNEVSRLRREIDELKKSQ